MRRSLIACLSLLAAAPAGAAAQTTEPENGRIAFSGKRGVDRIIYSRERTGRRLRRHTPAGRAEHPAFSRRGRRLAFTRLNGLAREIWVTYLDGTGLRQLTAGPTDWMPEWSPEGERVVFARGERGRRDLYEVTADGTDARRLTFNSGDEHSPAWAANGALAFVRRTPFGNDIWVLRRGATTARRVTDDRRADLSPSWSPSGRVLVIERGRRGRRDLWLVRADGSRERRLTRVRGDELEPSWSPDGTRVAFVHRRKGKRRVYVMKVKGKAVRRLPKRSRRVRRLTSAKSSPRQPSWQPAGFDPLIAAAGDIACAPDDPNFNGGTGRGGVCRQRMTSDLLLRGDLSAVLALGDLQYQDGEYLNFLRSYHPSWGRVKSLTRPVPGNHEYNTPGATGYYDYFNGVGRDFGAAGGRGAGFYGFDLGSWHLIALNSECEEIGGCGPDSPQMRWLRAELAAHPRTCTLAYWHRPRFTSGRHSDEGDMLPAWQALYAAGTDLALVGHEHFYERFAPLDAAGGLDPARGVRQIIAGMGGRSRFEITEVAPFSEVRDDRTMGVLEVELQEAGYSWRLRAAPSGRVEDAGSASCH